jgi:hypothetical protein
MERTKPPAGTEAEDPVVDGLTRYPEVGGNLDEPRTTIEFQERADAPEDADVLGGPQRRAKPPPLPRGQPKVPHGSPRAEATRLRCRGHPASALNVKFLLRTYLADP